MKNNVFNVDRIFGRVPDVAAVLLSGGIDSTTLLAKVIDNFSQHNISPDKRVHGISFNYGQRHSRELEAAAAICRLYDIAHHVIDLSSVVPNTMLKDPDQQIPDVPYSELKGVSPTYVPFRNGLMITAATSYATGILDTLIQEGNAPEDACGHIYAGVHDDDSAGFAYPDCTPEFAGAMANAVWLGSYGRFRFLTPFVHSSKASIVDIGDDLDAPLDLTWSCYKGEEMHCGTCSTCLARKDAFLFADVSDPTEYAE